MEVSGQLPAPFPLIPGKNPGNYLTEDQVGSRGSPDVLDKEIPVPCQDLSPRPQAHSIFITRNFKPNGRIPLWTEYF